MFKKIFEKSNEPRQRIESVSKPPREAPQSDDLPSSLRAPKSRASHEPSLELIEPSAQPAGSHPKRPSSGHGGAPKKAKRLSEASGSGIIPTPNRTHFHASILVNTDAEVAAEFIQGVCPLGDREILDKLDDAELLRQWLIDQSKAEAKMAAVVARARLGFLKPETALKMEQLKEDNARLSSKVEKYESAVRQLKDERRAKAAAYEETTKKLEAEVSLLRAKLERANKRAEEARAAGEKEGFEKFLRSAR